MPRHKTERTKTTQNTEITYWPNDKTLPFFMSLRGNSYTYLSRSEARELARWLSRQTGGDDE
jgi:hypothetical protein